MARRHSLGCSISRLQCRGGVGRPPIGRPNRRALYPHYQRWRKGDWTRTNGPICRHTADARRSGFPHPDDLAGRTGYARPAFTTRNAGKLSAGRIPARRACAVQQRDDLLLTVPHLCQYNNCRVVVVMPEHPSGGLLCADCRLTGPDHEVRGLAWTGRRWEARFQFAVIPPSPDDQATYVPISLNSSRSTFQGDSGQDPPDPHWLCHHPTAPREHR